MAFRNELQACFIPGTSRLRLDAPLIYDCPRLKLTISVPKGFDSDGASIPRVMWSLIDHPLAKSVRRPAVIHDFLYRTGKLSRADSDQLFYDALRYEGMGYIKSQLCWQALRLFGSPNYKGVKK